MTGFFLGGFIMAPIIIVPYVLWARAATKRLSRTRELLTLRESYLAYARSISVFDLWFFEIVSLILVLSGALTLILRPAKWPIALVAMIIFSIPAIAFGGMIRAKRSGRRSPPGS